MEEQYTNREIDRIVGGIKQHMDDFISPALVRIEAQTMKTNGRVTKLEAWRNWIAGGLAFVSVVGIPTVFWLISNYNLIKR